MAMLDSRKSSLSGGKVFLRGAVTDESAKDLTERLLNLEAVAPGKEITFYINTPAVPSRLAWRFTTR